MKQFGLIGYPLGHSFSAKYFNQKFEKLGLKEYRYSLYPIESLESVREYPGKIIGLSGLNITVPFKKEIISYLDEIDSVAEKVGAVNTVSIAGDIWKGYNTDVVGFRNSIEQWIPEIKGRKGLILGDGGGAAAARLVLEDLQIETLTISRNGGKNYDWLNKKGLSGYGIIVQCTPLGMWPDEAAFPDIPYSQINEQHFLFDMVYNPEKTIFLARGQEQGAKIMNGLNMLKFQAEAAWDIWNQ